ncbi:MAG: hypothetical protein CMI96_01830 [Pelagibacteraceae bacterium]|nr:hypothetical protein [Pelagibacteraceae bacterium]
MNFENLNIWSVTDGSQGMISQTNGLAKQFSTKVTQIKTDLVFPWNKLQPGILPIYKWIFKIEIPNNIVPDMVISCGRKSIYLSLYLKKKYKQIINIHIQNPKISSENFNFVISPNHDNFYGKNILNSVGALHHFTHIKNNSKENLLTCIIGGDNQHYYFDKKEIIDLCEKILEIKKNNNDLKLLFITSRRTSKKIKKILLEKMNSISTIWTGEGTNPYEYALKNSSFFIVTSDSTSMISESAVTNKPIYIFHLPFKRKSKRIENFHKEFNSLGITRNLENIKLLQKWTYDSLNESKRIASIIKKRIIEENL